MTTDPVAILRERFESAIRSAYPEHAERADALITPSKQPQFGDFQSNAAMPLAKLVGAKPRDVASRLIEAVELDDLAEPLDESSIAGPGFINIRLRGARLAALAQAMDTPGLGVTRAATPQTVVVDLFGVNLAKQMHVGHLRSTVIGDALARVLTRLGHTVIRQSHVGDWGLPIAMVCATIRAEADAGRLDLDALSLDDLDRLYRRAQGECAADRAGLASWERWLTHPKVEAEWGEHVEALRAEVARADTALTRAKATLVRLQAHDPEVYALWKRIQSITLDACFTTCARINANVTAEDTAGESTFAELLPEVVRDLVDRGIAEESDGAQVVRVEGIAEPCLIRKSDGGYLYATTDVAAIRHRVQNLGADRVIYAVDARQSLHFAQVFGVAHRAGYTTRPDADHAAVLEHAAFGTMLGEDGRPFKTRSGENVKLSALIDEAFERASAIVGEKNPEFSRDQCTEIGRVVAISAIKYSDLSTDRMRDYVFSFDRMLAFEGNTGPYLLYALVRPRKILAEARSRGLDWSGASIVVGHEAEKALVLEVLRYAGVLGATAEHLEPHRLCAYLYGLAGAFSTFYDQCPVLRSEDDPVKLSRLRLCELTSRVLADGLDLLGIPGLERM